MVLCSVLLGLLCNGLLHLPCGFQELVPAYQLLPILLAFLGVVRLVTLLDGFPCFDLHRQRMKCHPQSCKGAANYRTYLFWRADMRVAQVNREVTFCSASK